MAPLELSKNGEALAVQRGCRGGRMSGGSGQPLDWPMSLAPVPAASSAALLIGNLGRQIALPSDRRGYRSLLPKSAAVLGLAGDTWRPHVTQVTSEI